MRRLAFALLLTLAPLLAQAQNAFLRQQRIYAGDIAELRIIHDANVPSMYAVDTTPLLADFEVLGTESRVFRVKQDKSSIHRMEWRARLLPRRTGTLAIPALEFGVHRSTPLTLTVEPVPPGLEAAQRVFVEIEAQPPNPYPGQQTRIVSRLFHNLPLSSGALREPESAQAQIFRSGRERSYQVSRDGEAFTVLERSVVILPLAVSRLDILPAHISAHLPATGPGTIALEGETRYIHRKSEALQLRLRELPAGIDTRAWLPAEQLEVSLDWVERPTTLQPGDSLDLVLSILVRGLTAEALPENLLLRDNKHFTVYADQATRRTRVAGVPGDEYLVGHLQQRYAILIERAGVTSLPALRLDWWDTRQDRARVARLDAVTLSVSDPTAGTASGQGTGHSAAPGNDEAESMPTFNLRSGWPWLAGAAAALALLGLLAWYLRVRGAALRMRLSRSRSRRGHWQRLRRACRDNDALAARASLLGWSRLHWGNTRISGLRQIAELGGSCAWTKVLERLDAAIYAAQMGDWQGRELWQLVQAIRRRDHRAQPRARLPGPYPQLPPIPSRRRPGTSPRPA